MFSDSIHGSRLMDPLQEDFNLNGKDMQIDDNIVFNAGKNFYQCPYCKSYYSNKRTVKTHMKYDCGREPRFKCPYCNKKDKNSSNIYKHVRTIHRGLPVNIIRK